MKIVELDERSFGCEGAGVIRRVGSGVSSLSVGDRVAVIDRKTFSTIHITREVLCVKIPNDLGFDEASAMFFPYATAMHSLMTVGQLEKGQVGHFLGNTKILLTKTNSLFSFIVPAEA